MHQTDDIALSSNDARSRFNMALDNFEFDRGRHSFAIISFPPGIHITQRIYGRGDCVCVK
jgi:hypothetical protein